MAKSAKSKPTKATPKQKSTPKSTPKSKVAKVQPKPTKPKPKIKPEPKPKIKKKVKPEDPIVPEPELATVVPSPEPKVAETVEETIYLSDEEFDEKYKVAMVNDFQEGQPVFTKESYGDKWIAKQVPQIGVVAVDSAAFNDLVLRGEAYIKK